MCIASFAMGRSSIIDHMHGPFTLLCYMHGRSRATIDTLVWVSPQQSTHTEGAWVSPISINIIVQSKPTSLVLPCLILFGHQAIPGTLIPPSHVDSLPHLRRPALPARNSTKRFGLMQRELGHRAAKVDGEPFGLLLRIYPLSEVRKTKVSS